MTRIPDDVREILHVDLTERGMQQWFAPRALLYETDRMAVLVDAERLIERLSVGQGGV